MEGELEEGAGGEEQEVKQILLQREGDLVLGVSESDASVCHTYCCMDQTDWRR